MIQKQCQICGKTFNADRGAKYCSIECSKEGEKLRRIEWLKKNPEYLDKKRQWNRDYRTRKSDDKIERNQAEKQQASDEFRAELEAIRKKRQIETEQAALEGDIDALMEIAFDADDMETYYTLYKQSILDNDERFNVKNRYGAHFVGQFDVYDPDFVEMVVAVLNQTDPE